MRRLLLVVICLGMGGGQLLAAGRTVQVGPSKPYAKLSQALRAAGDGDTIEIDSRGNYAGDVCLVRPKNLTIRGVGPERAKFPAAGKNYGGKAIWVIRGSNVTVENIEFSGARVRDRNGAGIRAEGKDLTVRNCRFHDCEDGILGGAGTMLIEHSEFSACGLDGQSHNLYITTIDKLIFRHNYSHHAKVGHLLKSRARENHILYNVFSDGKTGSASYTVNLPNGGMSYLVGNVLVQGPRANNGGMIAYGEEGMKYPVSELYIINNTLVNNRRAGTFIQARKLPAGFNLVVINNIFTGRGTVCSWPGAKKKANFVGDDPGFVDRQGEDFHLTGTSACIDKGVDPGKAGAMSLVPVFHYVHPHARAPRGKDARIDIGAFEFSSPKARPTSPPPIAKVAGPLDRTVKAGQKVSLSAAGSSDPDGNKLSYRWWRYDDVDTATAKIEIANAAAQTGASFVVPNEPGKTIHVVLDVTDDGAPPLGPLALERHVQHEPLTQTDSLGKRRLRGHGLNRLVRGRGHWWRRSRPGGRPGNARHCHHRQTLRSRPDVPTPSRHTISCAHPAPNRRRTPPLTPAGPPGSGDAAGVVQERVTVKQRREKPPDTVGGLLPVYSVTQE